MKAYIYDARIGSGINNLKRFIKMATISIEFGKESSQKMREVYLLVRQGKTRQRVKTEVRQTPILPGPPYLRHPIEESHEVQ